MSRPKWDYIAKIVMIGDSACGKSSLTIRLTDDRFSSTHDVTIAAEIGSKVVEVQDSKFMKLQIWDTAGQEHFRAVTRSYFRNAAGCLLVYDVTRRATFLHAKEWLDDIRDQADDDISICLVGNKNDLVYQDGSSKREVTYEEAEKWAEENKMLAFVETSAKTGDNVVEAYLKVANDIHSKIVNGKFNLKDKSRGVKANNTTPGLLNLSIDANAELNKGAKAQGGCC